MVEELRTGDDIIFLAPRDHGKLICSEQVVRTSLGWKKHGNLQVGDKVFTPEGNQTTITGIGYKDWASLEVEMSDGSKIKTHPHHEWEVIDRRHSRYGDCVKILETQQILKEGLYLQGVDSRARWWLSNPFPLKQKRKDLRVPPYVLGAWLGDGGYNTPTIYHGTEDQEVAREVSKYYEESSRDVHKVTGVTRHYYPRLRQELKLLGVLGGKHIPREYFYGSIEQRLDLLAGLLDTDGCVEKLKQKNRPVVQRVRFTNCNRKLLDGVEELCRGLGFKVSRSMQKQATSSSGVVGRQDVYTIRIIPTLDVPTRISRKRVSGCRSSALPRLFIKSITPCELEEGNCIQIEDPRGMYLVGRSLIPTHNSHSMARAYPIWKAKYDHWIKEIYILGADQASAVDNLDKIKLMMASGATLRHLLPKGRSQGLASRTELQLRNGVIIRAKGWMSPLRGRHPQLIVMDDILNISNSDTADARDKSKKYFWEVVFPMKDKGTATLQQRGFRSQMVAVGTPQDWDDLYHVLLTDVHFRGKKQKAVIDDEKKIVLWPERYSYEDLMAKKQSQGPLSFSKEYQCEPISDDTSLFPSYIFDACKDESLSYVREYKGGNPVFLGADFSIPGSRDRDRTSVFVFELDLENSYITPLWYWLATPSDMQQQLMQVEHMSQAYKVTLGYLEDNMFQKVYAQHFQKKTYLPIQGHTVTHSAKVALQTGIVSFRPLFENARIRLPYKTDLDKKMTDELVKEFNGVVQKKGKIGNFTYHDDILVSFWHALEASRSGVAFSYSFL